MRNKRKKPDGLYIIKVCGYCNAKFYAKRSTAKFCSDTCRTNNYLGKNRSNNPFGYDPNEGKILAPGTIPSQEMPEDKLVFIGDLASLYRKLTHYITCSEELVGRKKFIERLEPYSKTHDWQKSMTQIMTDEYFMEVFRILPADYKLYVWAWGEDNQRPF